MSLIIIRFFFNQMKVPGLSFLLRWLREGFFYLFFFTQKPLDLGKLQLNKKDKSKYFYLKKKKNSEVNS